MKILKSSVIFLVLAAVSSALPLVSVYTGGKSIQIEKNESVAGKLQGLKGDRFAFIVMGDPECGLVLNDAAALKIVSNINREGRFKKVDIDSCITAGDNVFRGKTSHYRIYKKLVSRIKFPVISVPGNHDYDDDGQKYFKETFGANELAFGSRNSYFIILDNNEGSVSQSQF